MAMGSVVGALVFSAPYSGRREREAQAQKISGIVTAKEWIPGTTFPSILVIDKAIIPISTLLPDKWMLKVGGKIISVTKERFDKTVIGDFYEE
jgi:hypothetical protein